jgi:hypothetical protein
VEAPVQVLGGSFFPQANLFLNLAAGLARKQHQGDE